MLMLLFVQVDHHVGANLKSIMSLYFHEEMASNQAAWWNQSRSDSERRMLMATWLADAWETIAVDSGEKGETFLRKAFVKTGRLVGSDESAIEVPGFPNYSMDDADFGGLDNGSDSDNWSDDDENQMDINEREQCIADREWLLGQDEPWREDAEYWRENAEQ
jgi:hypothetical protein